MSSISLVFILLSAMILVNSEIVIKKRIFGGNQAEIGQFPYQVSVREVFRYKNGEVRTRHICGGALLSDSWVITAARCLQNEHSVAKNIVIVVGAHHIMFDGDVYEADSIVVHPEFNGELNFMKHDIGLIKIDGVVQMTEFVKPIDVSEHVVGDTDSAVVSGWGLEEDGLEPIFLKYLNVHIIGKELCIQQHKEHAVWVHNSTICTFKQNGEGLCQGDYGNPLVMDNKLVGIASWTEDCAAGKPDQYTRISSYIDFIRTTLGVFH